MHKPARINCARLHEIYRYIKKTNKQTNTNTESYQVRLSSYQVRPESIQTFEPSLILIKQGEKRKLSHFSTKNPINKPAMNNRGLLIAAVFHFVHPVEIQLKTSQVDKKLS